MQNYVSKSALKAKALEYFREVETTGKPIIVTDHGKPKLEVRKYQVKNDHPLRALKGSVLRYQAPYAPINEDDWEALR